MLIKNSQVYNSNILVQHADAYMNIICGLIVEPNRQTAKPK